MLRAADGRGLAAGILLGAAAVILGGCGSTAAPAASVPPATSVASASSTPAATASPALPDESQSRPEIVTGSQLAVVVAVPHRPSHTTYPSTFAGVPIHAAATVAGAFGTPTGTVQSRVYSNGTCSGFIEGESSPTSLSGGAVDITAFTYAQSDSGAMSWIVHYSGNGTYAPRDSACVAMTVLRVSVGVSTFVHDPTHATKVEVPLGTSVHPRVVVSGSVDTPTGSVRARWWQNGNCFGDATFTTGLSSLASGAVDMTGFVRPSNTLGSYSFRAEYLGDTTYLAVPAGPCVEYVVVKAAPKLSVSVHDAGHEPNQAVAVGQTVHLAAQLSGSAGTPFGTLTLSRYGGTSCAGSPVSQGSSSAGATVDPVGTSWTRGTPGSQSWKVQYSGSSKYNAATSACVSMRWLEVPAISAVVHDAAHHDGSVVSPGTAVHLSVTASGSSGTVTGNVAIYYYPAGVTCPGAGLNQGTGALSSQVLDDPGIDVAPLVPGTYRFQPVYNGSATYYPKIGPCVAFTVVVPPSLPPPATAPPIVTPAPTKAPTAPPTKAPTAPPNVTPAPNASTAPTGAPGTSAAPGASSAPGTTGTPSGSAGPSGAPGATAGPGATAAPGASPGGTSATGPGGGPSATTAPTTPAGSAGGGDLSLLLLLLVAGALVIGAVAFARRRGRPAE